MSARAAIVETISNILSLEGRGDDIESSWNGLPYIHVVTHLLTG